MEPVLRGKNVVMVGYPTYDEGGLYVGGTERVTDVLLRYLVDSGANVRYFALRRMTRGLARAYMEDYGCEVLGKGSLSWDSVRAFRPDFAIVSTCTGTDINPLIDAALSKLRCPVLFYSHGVNCFNVGALSREFPDNENFHFTCLNDRDESAQARAGVPAFRSHHVWNVAACDVPDELQPVVHDAMVNCRLVPQKGADNAALICARAKWGLVAVGRDSKGGKGSARLGELLGDALDYRGVVPYDEAMGLMGSSALFMHLPNGWEGAPLSVIEAMALGTPVVTWDGYGMKDFVEPSLNVVLEHGSGFVDQFVEEFLPRIMDITSDASRSELRKWAAGRYGVEAYRSQIESLVREIMEEN